METLAHSQIIAVLEKSGYKEIKEQEKSGQISFQMNLDGIVYPCFAKIMDGDVLIQVLAFIPTNIQKGVEGDLARLLHMINKEVDLPGFGMDEASGTLFYRQMVPCLNKEFDPKLFEAVLKGAELAAMSFINAIVAVASGKVTYADVLAKAREQRS